MPQNEYIEDAIKSQGRRLDYSERKRKRTAREPHLRAEKAQKAFGFKAKLLNEKNRIEKVEIRKKVKAVGTKDKHRILKESADKAIPTYLMDRGIEQRAKILSNMVKEKRKEKAGKWTVPLSSVKGVAEQEIFKVVTSGKRNRKAVSFYL